MLEYKIRYPDGGLPNFPTEKSDFLEIGFSIEDPSCPSCRRKSSGYSSYGDRNPGFRVCYHVRCRVKLYSRREVNRPQNPSKFFFFRKSFAEVLQEFRKTFAEEFCNFAGIANFFFKS